MDTVTTPKVFNFKIPNWTVHYNIVSEESHKWVGTGWEFFDLEKDAEACYKRQIAKGNCPTKRPFYRSSDFEHLGAIHRVQMSSNIE